MDYSISAIAYEVLRENKPSLYATSVSGAVDELIRRHSNLIEGKKIRRTLVNAFVSKKDVIPNLTFSKILEDQGYVISDIDPIPYTRAFRRIREGKKVRVISRNEEFYGKTGRVSSIKIEKRIVPLIEVTFLVNGKKITEEFREHNLEVV